MKMTNRSNSIEDDIKELDEKVTASEKVIKDNTILFSILVGLIEEKNKGETNG